MITIITISPSSLIFTRILETCYQSLLSYKTIHLLSFGDLKRKGLHASSSIAEDGKSQEVTFKALGIFLKHCNSLEVQRSFPISENWNATPFFIFERPHNQKAGIANFSDLKFWIWKHGKDMQMLSSTLVYN